jgi:type VI secretion system protein ImpA
MPIQLEELLNPISPDLPAGSDLRYAPIASQIREARRNEEALSQGEWKRDIKTADYLLVTTLATKALRQNGKDLQVAAWLTEALLAREGLPGLRQGLELLHGLLTTYWDTVYPLIEDGEVDLRANPLNWVATQLDPTLKQLPVTQDGLTWTQYTDSRTVATEQDSQYNTEKALARQEAIEAGKLTPEQFDKSFDSTPLPFYETLRANLTSTLDCLATLSSFCDEKFGREGPDFSPLKTDLEELGKTVHVLLIRKGGGREAAAPAAPVATSVEPSYGYQQQPQYVEPVGEPGGYGTPAPQSFAPPQPRPQAFTGPAPADPNSAFQQAIQAAHFLRAQSLLNPVPYLILRAIRWGEWRAAGYLDPSLAEAPPTEMRVAIKNFFNTGDYEQTVHAAEQAMATPCGRAWLDLQRFVVRCCRFTGNENVARAIVSELRALLTDFPELPNLTLTDDTPAANAETKAWLEEEGLLARPAAAAPPPPEPPPMWSMPPPQALPTNGSSGEEPAPDVCEIAMQVLRSGQPAEAIRLLSDEIYKQQTGRRRFLLTAQLARICLAGGRESIALPILRQLAAEIDEHRLEGWEERDLIVQPLSMLYQCTGQAGEPDGDRQNLYARICRIDPVRALDIPK